jgi:hypothetical protein
MKNLAWLVLVVLVGLFAYQVGHVDAPVVVVHATAITAERGTVTQAQWERSYEMAYAPACYGHPRNNAEVDIIAGFNHMEGIALNQAYANGEIRNGR